MRTSSVAVVTLLMSCALSGCIGSDGDSENSYPSIWERGNLEWDTSGTFSRVLETGPYYALDVQEAMIEVHPTHERLEVGVVWLNDVRPQ